MTRIRRSVLVAVLVLASACASVPPNLSPTGRAAFQATQAVRVLDVVRDFAVAANDTQPPLIARNDMRRVVQWHASIVRTIRAVPDGWKPIALAGLEELRAELPPETWKRLQPYLALVRAVIQEAP